MDNTHFCGQRIRAKYSHQWPQKLYAHTSDRTGNALFPSADVCLALLSGNCVLASIHALLIAAVVSVGYQHSKRIHWLRVRWILTLLPARDWGHVIVPPSVSCLILLSWLHVAIFLMMSLQRSPELASHQQLEGVYITHHKNLGQVWAINGC